MKSEQEPVSKPKRLKSEQEPVSETKRMKSEKEPRLTCEWNIFSDEISEESEDDAQYFILGPYDAVPRPRNTMIVGGFPIVPIDINERNRPELIELSKIALDHYNNKREDTCGSSFEFHDLVKCTFWAHFCASLIDSPVLKPSEYYITFQAKAKGNEDPSHSPPAIKTFQAKLVLEKPPVVEECHIKI
ncbi:hypothetical protein P8452_73826 [Trifolium repens]|nr:hypothetical protein P8452_73826 [Trifolium repens]